MQRIIINFELPKKKFGNVLKDQLKPYITERVVTSKDYYNRISKETIWSMKIDEYVLNNVCIELDNECYPQFNFTADVEDSTHVSKSFLKSFLLWLAKDIDINAEDISITIHKAKNLNWISNDDEVIEYRMNNNLDIYEYHYDDNRTIKISI